MHHRMRRAVAGAGGQIISNGSAVDFEFDSLTNWSSLDAGNSVTTQTTFDGRSVFKLDSGATFNAANLATRERNITPFTFPAGDTITFTYIVQHDGLGPSTGDLALCQFSIYYEDEYQCQIRCWSDKVRTRGGGGVWQDTDVAVTPPIDGWNIVTGKITGVSTPATATVDLYYNSQLVATGHDTAYHVGAAYNKGGAIVQVVGREDPGYVRRISYFDRLLVGDGLAWLNIN